MRWEENSVHGSVLVVEDDPSLRTLFCRSLRHEGLAVVGVGTLQDARLHATLTPPDVIVADEWLPDGTGTSLLRELRYAMRAAGERTPGTILLAGDIPEEWTGRALRKPCSIDLLARTVRAELATRRWMAAAAG